MGTITDKIERFLRGESWLHFVTMIFVQLIFICLSIIVGIYDAHKIILYIIPLFIGTCWELLGKFQKQKPITLSDIIATVLGGTVVNIMVDFIIH